jgi:hypothetical protein
MGFSLDIFESKRRSAKAKLEAWRSLVEDRAKLA